MLSDSLLPLVAAIDQLLEPSFKQSITFFGIPPVLYVSLAAILVSIALGYLLASSMRLKGFGWKFSLILASWAFSIAIIVFGVFKLGADLRGGVNLVYEVDEARTALLNPHGKGDYDLNSVIGVLRQRLNPSGVKDLVIRKAGPKQIEIIVSEVDKAQIDDIKARVTATGSLRFLIVADNESNDAQIREAALEQEKDPVRKKSYTVNVSDDSPEKVEKTIGIWTKVAREDRTKPNSPLRYSPAGGDMVRNSATGEILTFTPDEIAQFDHSGQGAARVLAAREIPDIEVLLRAPDSDDLDVRGEDLAYAWPSLEADGYRINFTMKGEGIGKMGALTGQNLPPPRRQLAVVFDSELISAPTIEGQITEQGYIHGRFTEPEVRFMSELLKSGSMPVVLFPTPIAENLIGSILGLDTIIKGSWSLAISLLVVLVLVALYYRFAGITAALALVLNLLLTVAIMIIIQAPFTLPGLAGLVLTVGMSIDANVLIFERIREETERGAALRMALRNGFDRALSAIIDGNLTTFLTALVLYVIGTDQLRGFGITLMLGNVISMFTAIFCARVIFDAGERTRWLTSMSMTKFLTHPNVDWVKLFPPMTIASCLLIFIGLVATVSRGAGIFDIDLKGGSSVIPMLRQAMSADKVRLAMRDQFDDVKDPKTNSSVDYQVYEISIAGEAPGTVHKIDSSLEKVADLEKHVQQALKDPKTGADRIRTYHMEYKILETTGAAPAAGAAESAAPPVQPEEKGAAAGEKEKTAGEKSSDCGQEDKAAKSEVEKAKDSPVDEKAAPAKAEGTKAPPAAPESSAATPPAAETKPAAPSTQKTVVEIRFPDNRISAYALLEHIRQASERAIAQHPFVEVANPQWDGRDNAPFETWKTTLPLGEEAAKAVLTELKKSMDATPVWQNSSSVSGQVTLDMQLKALSAVLVSLLGIAAYIWFRFQKLSWGIAAIASLAHDTLVMLAGIGASYYVASALGFLGIEEFKISLTVVAGFLTLIGYSINDTIVIFDRIREIRGKSTLISAQMINDAINQTLSRTLLTGGLTLLVVVILYIWGGEGIHTFAFCMLIGVVSGTYSTVFIAAPMLLWLMKTSPTVPQRAKAAAIKEPVTTAGGRT